MDTEIRKKINPASVVTNVVSFVFHPLFIPFYTVVLYFLISPRFFLLKNIQFFEIYLFVVSILIPLLFFVVLKYSGLFKSILIETSGERLIFSGMMFVVYLIILNKIIKFQMFIELIPFFMGITLALLIMSIANYFLKKPSLHALALGGMLTFLMIWSYYTRVFILPLIALIVFITAIVMASRLYLKAHSIKELTCGFVVGILTQLIAFSIAYYFL
jgi:membrane-associated phospholipid phosphatase